MSLVFEGDSIFFGYGLPVPSTQNPCYLLSKSEWGLSKGGYYNFASTGALLHSPAPSGLLSVTDRYVYPHRPTTNGGDGGEEAVLYCNAGINDLAYNADASQLIGDMRAYAQRARADGFSVIFDTILPTQFPSLEGRRIEVNRAILSGEAGADAVLNSAQLLPDPSSMQNFTDGTHPSVRGNILRASYMTQFLSSGAFDPWGESVRFSAAVAFPTAAPIPSGDIEISGYATPSLNRGGRFDCVSGRFVAAKAGDIEVSFQGINQTGTGQGKIELRKNGLPIGNSGFALSSYDSIAAHAIVDVNPGDVISAWLTSGQLLPSPSQTRFHGKMLT